MLVSHVYENACSAARQRVGLGLRRARIKLLVVPRPESQISAFPLAPTIPGRTFVGYVLPISIVRLHPRPHRLLYHLPHLIRPEWRVSRGDGRDR